MQASQHPRINKITPRQCLKLVYGTRWRGIHDLDFVFADEYSDLSLMAMDAPEALPAGSMVQEHMSASTYVKERLTFRAYVPEWDQGAEYWRAKRLAGH